MKQVFLIFALISTFTTSALAHEEVGKSETIRFAGLVEFQIGQEWIEEANEGSIAINYTKNTVTLSLANGIQCPTQDPNCTIIAIAPTPVLQLELPVVDTYTDACGAVHTLAEVDSTPMDGMKEVVEVVDYSFMVCEIAIKNMTQVIYTTYNPWTNMTKVSNFGGVQLRLMPTFF